MKKVNFYGFLFFSTALIIINGCTTPEDTVIQPKSVLSASAGLDNQVILPTDYIILTGNYYYIGNTNVIDSFLWKKISGPSTYIIENPNSKDTKVSKLGKGVYEFELIITDQRGLTAKDTVKIIVDEFSSTPKEIISKNEHWTFPWYNAIEIEDFHLFEIQSVFKVYIQRDNNSEWVEVLIFSENSANKYEYFIETRLDGAGIYNYGSLYIFYYGSDTNDTPNIKILY